MLQRVISPVDGSVFTEVALATDARDRRRALACGARAAGLGGDAAERTRRRLRAHGAVDARSGRRDRDRADLADGAPGRADAQRDPARLSGACASYVRGRVHGPRRSRRIGHPGLPPLHPSRAARHRPCARAVELPVPHVGQRGRTGARRRQRRPPEDVAADAAGRIPLCRGICRRGTAARTLRSRPCGSRCRHAHHCRSAGRRLSSFTGSVEGGRAVQQAAANRFIGMDLELGGKDPAYVRADAPLEHAIENLVDGTYFNAGQSCCGIERIYVDRALFPQFVDGFVDAGEAVPAWQPAVARHDARADGAHQRGGVRARLRCVRPSSRGRGR